MKSWDCFAQWQKNHSAKRTWLIKCKSAKFVTIWWIQLTLHLCWENESILDISYHSVFCAFRTQASGECVSITIGLKKQGILHKKSIRFLGNKNKKKLLNSPLDDQTKHQSSICLYRWRKNSYTRILLRFRRINVKWDFLSQFSNTLFWQLFPSPSDKWQMISVVFWWFLTLFGIPKKWWLIDIYSDIQFARAVLQKPKCIWYHLPTLVPCCIGPCIVCVLERESARVRRP